MPKNPYSDSVWIVKRLDRNDSACDTIVGYAATKDEADAIAADLNAESEKQIAIWNQHCINCGVECSEFETRDDAVEELDKVLRDVKCGCAAVRIAEENGKFYVVCDSYSRMSLNDCIYVVNEVKGLYVKR